VTFRDCSSSHLDVRLMRACRALVAQMDPTPAEVAAGALAAFTWRTVDAELAELLAWHPEPRISEPLTRS
jgi:hypothetical protein